MCMLSYPNRIILFGQKYTQIVVDRVYGLFAIGSAVYKRAKASLDWRMVILSVFHMCVSACFLDIDVRFPYHLHYKTLK